MYRVMMFNMTGSRCDRVVKGTGQPLLHHHNMELIDFGVWVCRLGGVGEAVRMQLSVTNMRICREQDGRRTLVM